ncbi:MAG: type III-B CRISPR module RAMP protein Cmr6, partial [Alcanivoracaceae bacterium]|nr:type III-B CRISPR module RAMP protein Cmr6 [Alcanivoracaceae bacterium]
MSQLPLYQNSQPDFSPHLNKGLKFERFFNQFDRTWQVKDDAKTVFLNTFVGCCGDRQALENFTSQQFSLAHSLNGDGKVYELDWHMVTGMGNSHPVENGFSWHHTLGVPYIPGSQVKGIIRSLIEQYFDDEANTENGINKKNLLHEWFGSDDKKSENQNKDSQVGRFIFFDAIPVEKPMLVIDIMTPHMGKWYAEGDKIKNIDDTMRIPADWHDPVPIPFLVVKSAKFLFTIADRKGGEESQSSIDDVFEMLNYALELLGAGAKTQTGYGYMSLNLMLTSSYEEIYADKKAKKRKQEELERDEKDNEGKPDYYIKIKKLNNILNQKNLDFTKEYEDIEVLINIALSSEIIWKVDDVIKLLDLIENKKTTGFLKAKRPKNKFVT